MSQRSNNTLAIARKAAQKKAASESGRMARTVNLFTVKVILDRAGCGA